jgi:hypothetical protein
MLFFPFCVSTPLSNAYRFKCKRRFLEPKIHISTYDDVFAYSKRLQFSFGKVFSRIGGSTQSASPVASTRPLFIFIALLCGPISQMLAELSVIQEGELRMGRRKKKRRRKGDENLPEVERKARRVI